MEPVDLCRREEGPELYQLRNAPPYITAYSWASLGIGIPKYTHIPTHPCG